MLSQPGSGVVSLQLPGTRVALTDRCPRPRLAHHNPLPHAQAFDIEIPDEEAETMTTPAECVSAIKAKL